MKAARRRRIEAVKTNARLLGPTDSEWATFTHERDRKPIPTNQVFPMSSLDKGRSRAIHEFFPVNQGFGIERRGGSK